MLLHEFMTTHRGEILEACDFELRAEPDDHLAGYVADFYDETLRAVRRDSGIAESTSPLPGPSATDVFISADEMLLTSAIGNLVHNALKFSPPGATVRLVARSFEDTAIIEVEDQCGGLSHKDPAKLFEPYVKRREGNRTGTGLGLSIAKRAVEAMGGESSPRVSWNRYPTRSPTLAWSARVCR
jgi:signal transduction histidine kinase